MARADSKSVAAQKKNGRKLYRLTLRVVIHSSEAGGYWAEVPGFPGCVTEGDTLEEVRANIREAFAGVFAVMQEEAPSEPGQVEELSL